MFKIIPLKKNSMSPDKIKTLQAQALKVREHIVRMSTDGGCFIGASLSCTDLFVFLYNEFLNTNPSNLKDPNRDYLLLSKGHDVPALYGVFAELGWIEKDRLKNHLKNNDSIYWHPNRNIPGIEFYSGSLGHLPSVAVGIAMDIKIRGGKNKVVVVTGDGELNEGSVWESVLIAQAYKLDNLIFLVDRNQFQANIRTEDLLPLEPLQDKFKAFGCAVRRINGHNFEALEEAFGSFPIETGKPNVIIADTVRGKGLPSIAERADRWFCNFTHEEVDALLKELHGEANATLTSETLTVR
jgi:transketolase